MRKQGAASDDLGAGSGTAGKDLAARRFLNVHGADHDVIRIIQVRISQFVPDIQIDQLFVPLCRQHCRNGQKTQGRIAVPLAVHFHQVVHGPE